MLLLMYKVILNIEINKCSGRDTKKKALAIPSDTINSARKSKHNFIWNHYLHDKERTHDCLTPLPLTKRQLLNPSSDHFVYGERSYGQHYKF